jgi:hypothetical protein
LTAILLIGILFFNWYGYRLLTACWQVRAERRLESRLDADDYDGESLIFMKIHINSLSYYNSSTEFERVDGQIDINGVAYKYVKRRLFKDSLELMCIPDMATIRLQATNGNFFRQTNDLEQSSGQDHSTNRGAAYQKNPQQDYYPTGQLYVLTLLNGKDNVRYRSFPSCTLQAGYLSSTDRPPDHSFFSI